MAFFPSYAYLNQAYDRFTELYGHIEVARQQQGAKDENIGTTIIPEGSAVPAGPVRQINPFKDVKRGDWYYSAVLDMYSRDLMLGLAKDEFGWDKSLTRAMIVTILYRMAGEPAVRGNVNQFNDVPENSWYVNAVKWAVDKKIVMGYGDGKFGPHDPVTKEQLAVLIYRMQQASGKTPKNISTGKSWQDLDKTGAWAVEAVNVITSQALLNDIPGVYFNPQAPATRAEVASILSRYLAAE